MGHHTSLFRIIAAFVLSFAMHSGVQAEGPKAGNLTSSAALNAAERWATAVGQPDIAGLEALLHADYVHVHATALVESKSKFIEALQTGARKYDPIKIEDTNVRIFGDSAVISGKFVLKATTRDRVIEGVNRFVLLVVNTPNGLQVANFQATGIPQPK
jgi:ketosteroid isomerase-like protein